MHCRNVICYILISGNTAHLVTPASSPVRSFHSVITLQQAWPTFPETAGLLLPVSAHFGRNKDGHGATMDVR